MSGRFETGEGLVVRPVARGERARFDAELEAHHWLGARLVGEVVRYVAVDARGRWLGPRGPPTAFLAGMPTTAPIIKKYNAPFTLNRTRASNPFLPHPDCGATHTPRYLSLNTVRAAIHQYSFAKHNSTAKEHN
jgi:hypothetical protein